MNIRQRDLITKRLTQPFTSFYDRLDKSANLPPMIAKLDAMAARSRLRYEALMALTVAHYAAAGWGMLAVSGRPDLTYQAAQDHISDQSAYMKQFISDVPELSKDQTMARAASYFPGVVGTYNEVVTQGLPTLPIYPGDRSLNCHGYCACHLRVVKLEQTGDWDVFWVLDPAAEHCFVAGTLIETPDGSKAIESLKAGDLVMTPSGARAVTRLFVNEHRGALYSVGCRGKQVICTGNHPFMTQRGWVEAQDLTSADVPVFFDNLDDQLYAKIAFPDALNSVIAGSKVFILRFVSFLLSLLSVGQRRKPRMPVPVFAVNLDNKVADPCINDKPGLNLRVRFVVNAQIVENLKQLCLKASRTSFLMFLSHCRQSVKHLLFCIGMICVPALDFVDNILSLHGVLSSHVGFCGLRDKLGLNIGRQNQPESVSAIQYGFSRQSHSFSAPITPAIRIMTAQEVVAVLCPYRRLLDGGTFFAQVNASGAVVTANRAGSNTAFSFPGIGASNFKTANIGIFAGRATESIGSAFDRIIAGFEFAFSHRNGLSVSLVSSDIVPVYNIEVNDEHVYYANGFLVHNCSDCINLNMDWNPLNVRAGKVLRNA